jgi:uncharacterized membrane protein YdjX (TVP38/TMEM64 family)
MSIFKQRLSKKTKLQIAAVAAVILVIILYIVWDIATNGPLTYILTNKDEVVDWVRALGVFGPLAFMLLQALQTIVAPIPGNVTGAVGGFLFGWWGVLWTTIGAALGFFVVFWLSRKFGRTLVEKIVKKEMLDKFDHLTRVRGTFVFFLIFLIPGLPDDVVAYVAGLTSIPIKRLMVMAVVGRLPAVVVTNMLGAGLGEDDIRPVLVIVLITVMVLAAIAIKRSVIMDWAGKREKKGDGEKSEKSKE